jgi:hypothetical protein
MSGTALDHPLVRRYLRDLDAALSGLPAAQARELREQITAHLDDALGPGASDQEVAATLARLGSAAGLAAEAGAPDGSSGPRSAPARRRVRWRLAAVIAVLVAVAVALGALQISSVASRYAAAGRDQHLARLGAAVVTLTQDLEDERDLSAAYTARPGTGPVPLTVVRARRATDAAAATVRAQASGIGPGYQPATIRALGDLLTSLTDLKFPRRDVSAPAEAAAQIIRIYTDSAISSANAFSATTGGGTGDATLQGAVTTLAALLRVENDQSVQRAILYAALSAQPPVLAPWVLSSLQQVHGQANADLADFNAAADTTEQKFYSSTVSGRLVDVAAASEILAEQQAADHSPAPVTGTDAATWYRDMSITVGDTRKVTGQLTSQISGRANTLKSDAAKNLLLISIATGILLFLLLISALLARPRQEA